VQTIEEQKILETIGSKVRMLRKERNLSQFELGIAADTAKNQIGRIERALTNPTVLTLHKIAKVFDVNIKFFFE